MRTMLLSFKPNWYEKIKAGKKIFEYRTNFLDEEIRTYMYVSTPYKRIVGYIHLGKRIPLEKWKQEYLDNPEVFERIVSYMDRRNYVMPILAYYHTEFIELNDIRKVFPKFVCPQMYYFLDARKELLKYLEENMRVLYSFDNNFDNIPNSEICRIKYE